MQRQRTTDRLVGAGVAVLVIALALVAFLWWLSEPADDAAARTDLPRSNAVEPRTSPDPPTDLAEGETWLGDVDLDAGVVATPDASLRDLAAVAQDVRTGPDGLVVGSLSVQATVPFEVVEDELGEGNTVRAADGSQASVVREIEFGGRVFTVVATGTVEAVGGRLVVEPRSIDIGGSGFLSDALGDLARELVTIEHSIEGLPEGLVLEGVSVREDGFRADLRGADVQLSP